MGDYDYLNARVRAMAAGLLTPDFYEQVLATEGEELLIDALLNSSYGPYLREALAERHGIAAVEWALRRDIFDTFSRVRSYAPPEPRRLLNTQFNQWDTANVLAVVRGKASGADPEEILEGVLPAGEFSAAQLAELAAEPDLEAVADALTTWGYLFAFELRRAIRSSLRGATPAAVPSTSEGAAELIGAAPAGGTVRGAASAVQGAPGLAALEAQINRAYFRWALEQLRGTDSNTQRVRQMLRMQIDLANIKSSLDRVRHRAGGDDLEGFEVQPGGLLGAAKLEEIAGAGSLIEAFEMLDDTWFAPAIERGILSFGGAGHLGTMERSLEVLVIAAGCRLLRQDPLDVSVPLGFIWRKYNEFVNLRILVRGKTYRMPDSRIREEMLIV